MFLKHIFGNKISYFSVIDVTTANDLCLNGNRRQNGQGEHGMAIGQKIVSFVTFAVFQRETNVLLHGVRERMLRMAL